MGLRKSNKKIYKKSIMKKKNKKGMEVSQMIWTVIHG